MLSVPKQWAISIQPEYLQAGLDKYFLPSVIPSKCSIEDDSII
jgi:hypothetical protein